jgi:nitrogenase molybdenum-iron protein alpha chain
VDENNKRLLGRFNDKSIPAVVANGQPFEIANVLSKTKPDYYVGPRGMTSLAAECGALSIPLERLTLFGWDGVISFADTVKKIKRASRPQVGRKIYRKSWLEKSGNWYVKLEAK